MKTLRHRDLLWQLPLTLVFLAFGLLLAAQYYTHSESGSLVNESTANLALIIKSGNDNKQALEAELAALKSELAESQALVENGESLFATMSSRIANLQIVLGDTAVQGPGLVIQITGESYLMYYDLIDIVNERFVSGAEAVSINDTRFTSRTQISEQARFNEVFDETTQTYESVSHSVITVDGEELLYPIIIKAVGNAQTLAKGLDYPGGIIDNLTTLYGVYPTIRQAEKVEIPLAQPGTYEFAGVSPATVSQEPK